MPGTESSSRPQPTAHSLALLSLAGSLGLFQEALHTARHFPARLTGSQTSPAQQQPRTNRVGSQQASEQPCAEQLAGGGWGKWHRHPEKPQKGREANTPRWGIPQALKADGPELGVTLCPEHIIQPRRASVSLRVEDLPQVGAGLNEVTRRHLEPTQRVTPVLGLTHRVTPQRRLQATSAGQLPMPCPAGARGPGPGAWCLPRPGAQRTPVDETHGGMGLGV